MRTSPLLLALLASVLLLGGCMGRGPDTPIVTHSQAKNLRDPWKVEIIKVWDGLQHSRDPHVSHLLEARVIDGPKQVKGRIFCFPYDSWNVGKKPPEKAKSWSLRRTISFARTKTATEPRANPNRPTAPGNRVLLTRGALITIVARKDSSGTASWKL